MGLTEKNVPEKNVHFGWSRIDGGLEKGRFTLGSNAKKTLKLTDPIGQDLNMEPKGFILGSMYKRRRNDVAPKWYTFGGKFVDMYM